MSSVLAPSLPGHQRRGLSRDVVAVTVWATVRAAVAALGPPRGASDAGG
jgi:hypothetical protein